MSCFSGRLTASLVSVCDRLQLLETLYCVLFLRTSDVDRSSADDHPDGPGGGAVGAVSGTARPPSAGTRLLLTLTAQTAVTALLRERLAELQPAEQDDSELGRRRDR